MIHTLIVIALTYAITTLVYLFGGPTVKLWLSELQTTLKAKYEAEKAVILADATSVKTELQRIKTESESIISDLKEKLIAAEAKIASYEGLLKNALTPAAPITIVPPVGAEIAPIAAIQGGAATLQGGVASV